MFVRKVFYYYEGGLGDVLLQHFQNRHAGAIEEYRAMHECCYIKCLLNVQNPQAVELFRYVKGIDEIQVFEFSPNKREAIQKNCAQDGYVHWGSVHPFSYPTSFALGGNDEEYLSKVLPTDPYIAVQAGAGKPFMVWDVDADALARAASEVGLSVVLIGGTSERALLGPSLSKGATGFLPENSRPIKEANLTDLVGTANPRLAVEIVRRSHGFLGSLSCYMVASLVHNIPRVIMKPDGFEDSYVTMVRDRGSLIMPIDKAQKSVQYYRTLIGHVVSSR